jgi:hypothetical protein
MPVITIIVFYELQIAYKLLSSHLTETSRIQISRHSAHDGGEVVSLTQQPPLHPVSQT